MRRVLAVVVASAIVVAACNGAAGDEDVVLVGINAEITGERARVGEHSRNAAELFVAQLNEAGGIELPGGAVTLQLVVEDNGDSPEGSAAASTKLITQDRVAVIVGPNASVNAIPGAEVADANETPLISPWSTNPATTQGRPWVFRVPFLDDFQGPVVANFVEEEFGFERAAVLYNISEDYPKGLAEFFRAAWEDMGHEIVAFETFTTGDSDFSAQLTTIRESGAEFLFTPQYYNEVPLIVEQARDLGIAFEIVGSDSWAEPELVELCGDLCEGTFFSTHYTALGATGATAEFINAYQAEYGRAVGGQRAGRPAQRQPERALGLLAGGRVGQALVERVDDVAAESPLDLDRALRRQQVDGAVLG